ncbi:MAG: hypothetical protein WC704_11855 [Sphingomonas sp.]
MIVPQAIDVPHRAEVPQHRVAVVVDQIARPDGVGDRLAEMAIVAALVIEEIDVIVGEAPVAQPAAFVEMEAGRVVEAGIGFALPADIVEEFGGDIALRAEIALVRAVHLPAVVIDAVEQRVRAFEQRDAVGIPAGVAPIAFGEDLRRVEARRGRCRRQKNGRRAHQESAQRPQKVPGSAHKGRRSETGRGNSISGSRSARRSRKSARAGWCRG